MDWKPIESAPKGGEMILLWLPKQQRIRRVMVGFWRGPFGRFGYFGNMGIVDEKLNQPTRWMPLPSPPMDE